MFYLWLIVGLVLLVVEMLTGGFILLWFGVAGLLTALAALAGFSWGDQLGIFIIASFLLIVASRTIFKDVFMRGSVVKTNVEALIGQRATVVQEIDKSQGTGEVKIGAEIWGAISTDAQRIAVGTEVQIIRIEGAKLIVQSASPAHSESAREEQST
jgi:membrane protein implicated in regulation of membrane protease activity